MKKNGNINQLNKKIVKQKIIIFHLPEKASPNPHSPVNPPPNSNTDFPRNTDFISRLLRIV